MKRADLLATLDIGAAVKKLREMKGISQEELAKDICDRTNITKLENGYSKIPSLSFVLLICDKLELSIEEFLNFAMENSYSLNKDKIRHSKDVMPYFYSKIKQEATPFMVSLLYKLIYYP